ncbi:MAG: hypothetical protein IKP84_09175 [Prevotella sp.]|nr:hypothetical protein [Prevotella sp.]
MKTKRETNRIVYVLIVVCVLLLLHEPMFEWWCETGVGKFLNGIIASCFLDTIALLLIMLGCGVAIEIPGLLSETGNKWGRALAGCFGLILMVESVAFNEKFVHFYTLPCLRYTDVLVPILATFWIASWFEPKKTKVCKDESERLSTNLYYDDIDEIDFLGRGELVKHLCQRLKENKGNSSGATGIAISGGWGTGKSWVLEHIKKTLKGENQICIDFRPWLYGEVDMTRLFYQTLGNQLMSNGVRIEELNRAVIEIDNDELVGFGRAVLSLFGMVTKRDSRAETIATIKNKLAEENQQIFVFVDDIDRLAKKELLQVLSLIRNTGDFPNLTYILAFDKAVISDILEKEKGLGYVGKMINLPLELPPIDDEAIGGYLLETVKRIVDIKDKLDNPFAKIPITHYLPTVREAKRYLNLLTTDYKRREEVIGRYHWNVADYCLIELLKYKSPDVYYKLKASPSAYLDLKREGWNSPVWVPKKDCFKDDADLQNLLKAMFRVVTDPQDHYGMLGIANKDYFPLYFEGNNDLRYVDGEEFIDAIEREEIPKKIGKWLQNGHTGILEVLCIAQGYMSRKDIFLAIAEYIWFQCEKGNAVNSLRQLTAGYDKTHFRHSYRNIRELIADNSQIHLLTFQNMDREDNEGQTDKELTDSIGLTLEMMGIWMNELRHTPNKDYPYPEVKKHIKELWAKLTGTLKDRDIDTLDMIEICGDSTDEDAFEDMVLPLVCDNPQRWLGATVTKLNDGDKHYYLLKSEAVHALFGNQEKVQKEMKAILTHVKDEDKAYVEAYEHLIDRIAALTINNEDSSIPDKYKKADSIEINQLPALEESKFIGINPAMTIGNAIDQMRKSAFWKGENIRMYRDKTNFYFHVGI